MIKAVWMLSFELYFYRQLRTRHALHFARCKDCRNNLHAWAALAYCPHISPQESVRKITIPRQIQDHLEGIIS